MSKYTNCRPPYAPFIVVAIVFVLLLLAGS